MKNIVLTLALFATTLHLQAQTEKGTFALGLHNFAPGVVVSSSSLVSPTNAFGFSFGKSKEKVDGQDQGDDTKYSTVGLNFNGHYFIIDDFSAGLGLNFFSQTEKEDNGSGEDDKYTATIVMAGPELRYYFSTSPKTKVWLKGSASFGSLKTKINGEEDDDPTKLSTFGGGAGLAFFPNPNISIDLGLGYSVFTSKSDVNFGTGSTEYEDVFSGLVFDVGFGLFF